MSHELVIAKNIESKNNWCVLGGPVNEDSLISKLESLAVEFNLSLTNRSERLVSLYRGDNKSDCLFIHWSKGNPQPSSSQSFLTEPQSYLEILITHNSGLNEIPDSYFEFINELNIFLNQHSNAELKRINESMPILNKLSSELHPQSANWAVIFRDHFLEHSLGFILSLLRIGIDPKWIYAFDKGDKTINRHRITSTFKSLGIKTALFDNTTIDAPHTHYELLNNARDEIDSFISAAHSNSLKVLVIDDGGIIACGYGGEDCELKPDAVLELTISGLKRISSVKNLDIPVFNLAKSELKQSLGYPEIADSCLRRIRSILPGYKIIGKHLIVLGFGALGEKLSHALRSLGCQVHIVETDIVRLIQAAELGFSTFRCLEDALSQVKPFMIAGTTGDIALKPTDLPLLPNDVFLAPFATKDFSMLTTHHFSFEVDIIPSIGKRFHISPQRSVTVLGDGRSMNIFNEDSIPNEGYDAYRAGALEVVKYIFSNDTTLVKGLQLSIVDNIIRESELYDLYYERYLVNAAVKPRQHRFSAVIIGYGIQGRLHARLLADEGAKINIIDNKYQDLPGTLQLTKIEQLPIDVINSTNVWSICTPTADHLSSVQKILKLRPDASIILEKPACQANEISDFEVLLSEYPHANIQIVDQYKHTNVINYFIDCIRCYNKELSFEKIEIVFDKDRSKDIDKGRFIDRSYGVLGYEWLHMLSVLSEILKDDFDEYLNADISPNNYTVIYNESLFISSLSEKISLKYAGNSCDIHLSSDVLRTFNSENYDSKLTPSSPLWHKFRRDSDDRERKVILSMGDLKGILYFDPVPSVSSMQLPRNHHHIIIQRGNEVLHDEVLSDSPMHNALRHSLSLIINKKTSAIPEMKSLKRIANIANLLRIKC
ncbi:hypothetical protein RBJ15_11400 [Pantoea sp. BS_4]|uniref:hypothetical protein n=1 Tax=unclassified Pantoea TaxID=2630326 RepID=UPI0035C02178